jgi:predicted Zn-dependent peptidase
VTREDIQRVAKKYLHPDRMAVVVVANQEKAKLKY